MKRLLVLLVACKSNSAPPPPPPPPPAPPSATHDAAINSTLAPEPAAADLCDAYDRGGVVDILGWKGMQKVSANGLKNGERRERHCAYRALDKEATFGIAFSTDKTFLPHHAGFDITYAKRDKVDGMDAWIGRNKEMVSLQLVTHGIRIMTTLAKSGTPEEMEPRLVEATKKLVASMPADPLPMMHK
jgi:hypothetical protein